MENDNSTTSEEIGLKAAIAHREEAGEATKVADGVFAEWEAACGGPPNFADTSHRLMLRHLIAVQIRVAWYGEDGKPE